MKRAGVKKNVRPCICLYIESIFTWKVTRPCEYISRYITYQEVQQRVIIGKYTKNKPVNIIYQEDPQRIIIKCVIILNSNKENSLSTMIIKSNMKPARPWMLAHLKIIWKFHQKVSRFFGPRYIGDDFFLGPNLVELSFLYSSYRSLRNLKS